MALWRWATRYIFRLMIVLSTLIFLGTVIRYPNEPSHKKTLKDEAHSQDLGRNIKELESQKLVVIPPSEVSFFDVNLFIHGINLFLHINLYIHGVDLVVHGINLCFSIRLTCFSKRLT